MKTIRDKTVHTVTIYTHLSVHVDISFLQGKYSLRTGLLDLAIFMALMIVHHACHVIEGSNTSYTTYKGQHSKKIQLS